MPQARLSIQVEEVEAGPEGLDKIVFMFQPNRGEGFHPVAQVASGGELARVMLALKSVLAAVYPLPTFVFDEIDVGVSGLAASRMAEVLKDMGRERQVLCITHSPVIAAMADHHYGSPL